MMIKISEKKMRFTCTVIALSLGICLATVTTAADESGSHTTTASAENHGDEAEPNLNPLAFDPDLALFTGLVFLLLLLILWKFAWGPILTGLAAREDGIAANIDQAQQDAEAAAAKLQEYEEQLTAATEEARTIIAKAQVDAQTAADAIVAEATEAAQRQRDRAVADIETAKNVALGEVAEKSVDIALGLAGNIVRRQLTAEEHSELIRETLDKFPSNN
jgi:F-type H+-transporting ATPase subunit b